MHPIVRPIAAIFFASLTSLVAFVVIAVLSGTTDFGFPGAYLIAGYLFALSVMAVVGLPTHLLLERLGRRSVAYYASAGLPIPAAVVLTVEVSRSNDLGAATILAGKFGIIGLCAAVVFWRVAVKTSARTDSHRK